MQIQLNINNYKANIFLELLEVFKKDNLVNDYKIIDTYNDYEKEIISDLKNINVAIQEDGYKTDKYIEIKDI